MLKSVRKGLIAAGVLAAFAVQNASAALTASDVNMSTATADVTLVFLSILGLAIVIFGFKKILSLANGR